MKLPLLFLYLLLASVPRDIGVCQDRSAYFKATEMI